MLTWYRNTPGYGCQLNMCNSALQSWANDKVGIDIHGVENVFDHDLQCIGYPGKGMQNKILSLYKVISSNVVQTLGGNIGNL